MSHLPRTTLMLALMMTAAPLAAQQSGGTWQVRIPSGRTIATGDQRNAIKDAPVVALQVARTIGASTTVTTTLGWTRSRDLGHADQPGEIAQCDAPGAFARAARAGGRGFCDRRVGGFGHGWLSAG